MALVSLKCPNCDGSLKMEDTMEKGFCMYCGTSFLVKDENQHILVEHTGQVELSRNRELDNLLVRAEKLINDVDTCTIDLNVNQYMRNYLSTELSRINSDYLEKALDIDPNNVKVQRLKEKIASISAEANEIQQKNVDEANRIFKMNASGCLVLGLVVLGMLFLFLILVAINAQ